MDWLSMTIMWLRTRIARRGVRRGRARGERVDRGGGSGKVGRWLDDVGRWLGDVAPPPLDL